MRRSKSKLKSVESNYDNFSDYKHIRPIKKVRCYFCNDVTCKKNNNFYCLNSNCVKYLQNVYLLENDKLKKIILSSLYLVDEEKVD